ncbi:MAG TPA: DNA-binding response regulator [Firmicutes bacterium]|nr:DNA-binding response regulator [Bacillota bacterium]
METPTGKVLVVDDEQKMCEFLELVLSQDGHQVLAATSGEQALDIIKSNPDLDVIVTDLMMPKITGMEVLEEAKRMLPDTPVIMITGYSTVENAVQAMKAGAFDYLPKPFKVDEVKLVVKKALDRRAITFGNKRLRRGLQTIRERSGEIIGTSEKMQEVFRLVEKVARTDATILIRGESGTGKDLIAREIHMQSLRSEEPFVSINCAALPETLLESELFGHARGAFTGAHMTKRGLFEEADGGTVFLDEIGDISLALQAKLLRFLQNREFIRIGETTVRSVDVRVIVATNKDLEAAIERGSFRSDLYYRLNVITIHLPPLRERRSDIPLLAKHFAQKFAAKNFRGPITLSPEAMDALINYEWPGNVRELENAIERAVILMEGDTLDLSDLPDEVVGGTKPVESEGQNEIEDRGFYDAVDDYKRKLIEEALERSDGVQAKAADLLGLKRTTLNEMMKRLGM